MNAEKINARLAFLEEAERLKNVVRSAHTTSGKQESTAEHSWRLCLMAMAFEDELRGLDMLKVLKMCVIHDLGEAIHGDIPAINAGMHPEKAEQEKEDLLLLMKSLDEPLKTSILELWEDYENAASPEAMAVKALDKLETILQHNQGKNPPGFDYRFNLSYGRNYTDGSPFFETVREMLDGKTRSHIR